MKYWVVLSLAVGWLAVPVPGGSAATALPRLVYVFSPDRAEQLEHIQDINRLARLYKGRLAVVGVVRPGMNETAPDFNAELAFPLVAAAYMAQQDGWSQKLEAGLVASGGYLLLEDRGGVEVGAGTDYKIGELGADLIQLIGGSIATDIDQSTWGKVKELFK
jgi:hypothetical protein